MLSKSQAFPERGDEIEKVAKRHTDFTGKWRQYRVLGLTNETVPGEEDGSRPFVKSDELVTRHPEGIYVFHCARWSPFARGNPSIFRGHKPGTRTAPLLATEESEQYSRTRLKRQ